MTLFDLRRTITQQLISADIEDAHSLARYLVCDVLGLSMTQMIMADRDEVSADDEHLILSLAQRITDGEPLQYVTHKAYFHGHEFFVDRGALIPRPETELLVDEVIKYAESADNTLKILDIGTGSGCIALSLKAALPDADIHALDVSSDALAIAKKNSELLGCPLSFHLADIFSDVSSLGQFDVVVSNPPYICDKEKVDMKANVLDYEPHIALFVPDNDPLRFYRQITQQCGRGLLSPGGALFFEVNEAYSSETLDMMINENFVNTLRIRDLYEKWRVCSGIRK